MAITSLRIFVVENHLDTLKYLRMYLEDLGHIVFEAHTLAEAFDTISSAKCNVLISDIGLPDGDGWELLRKLQNAGKSYPIYSIAMSGFGMNADRHKSNAAGYRQHILKPFDPEKLDGYLEQASAELAGLKAGA